RVPPGFIAMNPATAVAMMIASASLWIQAPGRATPRRLLAARVAAAVVVLIGATRLLSYIFGADVGLDRLLFGDRVDQDVSGPNRMAPNTATCFIITGCALLLFDRRTSSGRHLTPTLALSAGMLATLATLGYAYNV